MSSRRCYVYYDGWCYGPLNNAIVVARVLRVLGYRCYAVSRTDIIRRWGKRVDRCNHMYVNGVADLRALVVRR